MRKLLLHMQVTIDGYVGDRDGSVDWAFPGFDEEFTQLSVGQLWQAGVHIMGGNTGKDLAQYWPDPTEPRDLPFAPAMNEIPKVIFSKTLTAVDWHDTRIASGDLVDEVGSLKSEDGKPILAHGGTKFAHALIRSGLIDEYDLVVHPVVLGAGQPLFPDDLAEPLRLEVVETRQLRSGCVFHVYRPVGMDGGRS